MTPQKHFCSHVFIIDEQTSNVRRAYILGQIWPSQICKMLYNSAAQNLTYIIDPL